MIIAGLGNPGKEYDKTRHNVGFWAIDALSNRFRAEVTNKQHQALLGKFCFRGQEHILIKPQTFMNLSGESISSLLLEQELPPQQLLVIVDDINLPTGRIRLRSSGSDGGHNGLKSIINHIGKKFWRLRIGVGLPVNEDSETTEDSSHEALVDHVLGEVSSNETEIFDKILAELPDLVALWLLEMGNKAMTKFNGKRFDLPEKPEEKE